MDQPKCEICHKTLHGDMISVETINFGVKYYHRRCLIKIGLIKPSA